MTCAGRATRPAVHIFIFCISIVAIFQGVYGDDNVDIKTDTNTSNSTDSSTGRGYKKMAQTILPLIVGFKMTGLLVMAMAFTKLILLKAMFLSTVALAISALLALKKLLGTIAGPVTTMTHYTAHSADLSQLPYLHDHTGLGAADVGSLAHGDVPVAYIGGTYGVHGISSFHPAASAASATVAGGALPDLAGAGDSTMALQIQQHLQGLQNLPALQQQQLIQQQFLQQQQQQLQQQQLLALAASNHSGLSQGDVVRRRTAGRREDGKNDSAKPYEKSGMHGMQMESIAVPQPSFRS